MTGLFSFLGNGWYTQWTEFSSCSVTCGGGMQQRTRECTKPAPSNGGKDCNLLGAAFESRNCSSNPCPSKSLFNIVPWSNFLCLIMKSGKHHVDSSLHSQLMVWI